MSGNTTKAKAVTTKLRMQQGGIILVLTVLGIVFVYSILSLLPFLPGWHKAQTKIVPWSQYQTIYRYANFSAHALYNRPETPLKPFLELNVKDRIEYVRRKCLTGIKVGEIHVNNNNDVYVFVDHEHKIIACSNLKAASSTVASIFYRLLNISSTWTKYRRKYLQQTLTVKEFNSYDYVKFMIAREPLEKLMSVYKEYWAHPEINGTRRSFPQFMSEVGAYVNYSNDMHYMSTMDRCRPCDVGYTYIAATDTLEQDLKTIMSSINHTIDTVPVLNAKNTQRHRRYLRRLLSNETKKAIWYRYKLDYQMFGFPYPR